MKHNQFMSASASMMDKEATSFNSINEEYHCIQDSDEIYVVFKRIWFVEE